MNNFLQTLQERQYELYQALGEHLQLSLLALVLSIGFGIGLALLVINHNKLKEFSLQVAGIFQTIPSLALLGLFIPILGIGEKPTIVVLVIYGIFPILQSTLVGLQSIDPMLEEAGTAFGMNRIEKLRRYELPLAMPAIIGGIRTSAVMLIGTATLAALVGAGGLGTFILLGIDRNDTSLILIGAIAAALLAIIVNSLLKVLEKRRLRTITISFFVVLLLLIGSFTNFLGSPSKTLVVAGKVGAEQEILINMYKELIEANTDISVEVKPHFGKTPFLFEALKNGTIDIYPEFAGTITASLLKPTPTDLPNDKDVVYETAKEKIKEQDDLDLLEPMEFEDNFGIAVKKDYAQKNNLKTISDLKKVESSARVAFGFEFNDREDGYVGLKKAYGLNLKIKTMEMSVKYKAIETGKADVIEVNTTDAKIIANDLILLEDDKHFFPPYQGAPLMKSKTLKENPDLAPILNKLHNKISTKEMQEMNYRVDFKGEEANKVAKEYLQKNGLI